MASSYTAMMDALAADIIAELREQRRGMPDSSTSAVCIDNDTVHGFQATVTLESTMLGKISTFSQMQSMQAKKKKETEDTMALSISFLSPDALKLLGFCYFTGREAIPGMMLKKMASHESIAISDVDAACKELVNNGFLVEDSTTNSFTVRKYTQMCAKYHMSTQRNSGEYVIPFVMALDEILENKAKRELSLIHVSNFINKYSKPSVSHLPANTLILTHYLCKWAGAALECEEYLVAKTLYQFASQQASRPEVLNVVDSETRKKIQDGLSQVESALEKNSLNYRVY